MTGTEIMNLKEYLKNRQENSIKKIARECQDILQEFGISEED